MSALSGIPAYWLNFLLHTALLSTFVWLGCLLIRDPGRRAFAAAAGVFAVAAIPWFSALRPPPSTNQAKADVPVKCAARIRLSSIAIPASRSASL